MDKVSWDGIHQPRNSSVSSTLSEMLDHLKATIGPLDDRFVSKGGWKHREHVPKNVRMVGLQGYHTSVQS